jgi:hypothetical protein
VPEPLSPDKLLDLYRIAIDEYRFEVRLNWDRSMYYITFNTALIAAAAGLLKLGKTGIDLYIAGIFGLGFVGSLLGIFAIRKGHEYYLRATYKKTLLEDLLGLGAPLEGYSGPFANLSVATTVGQSQRQEILYDTERFLKKGLLRPGSIVFFLACFLGLLAIMNVIGAVTATWLFFAQPPTPYIPWP